MRFVPILPVGAPKDRSASRVLSIVPSAMMTLRIRNTGISPPFGDDLGDAPAADALTVLQLR